MQTLDAFQRLTLIAQVFEQRGCYCLGPTDAAAITALLNWYAAADWNGAQDVLQALQRNGWSRS